MELNLDPGIYDDLSSEDYHGATDVISSTGLKKMLECPLAYWRDRQEPPEPTAAMIEGTILHTLILEPEKDAILIAPHVKRNTVPGKEAWADFLESAGIPEGFQYAGKNAKVGMSGAEIVCRSDRYAELCATAGAVSADPWLKRFLKDAEHIERSFVWDDLITGLRCKVRSDLITDGAIVVDIKTGASVAGFGRNALNYGYPLSAAFYLDGINATMGEAAGDDGAFVEFVFVAFERVPVHPLVLTARATASFLEFGRLQYREALNLYAECKAADLWPSLGQELKDGKLLPVLQDLELPPYARTPDGRLWREMVYDI